MDEQALNANLIRRVNLGDTLTRTAWRLPQHEAVVEGERRLTYAELNAEVNRLANALAGRGYGRGDPILLVAGNCLEFLQTYYACAKLGAVCVPINLLWGPAEVAYVVEHCGARAAIVAVPPNLTGSIHFEPALPGWRMRLAQATSQGFVTKFLAVYDEPFWRAEGLSGEGFAPHQFVRELYDNSPPSASVGVLCTFLPGESAEAAARMSYDVRRTAVLEGLAKFVGPRALEAVDYIETDWSAEEWTRGAYAATFGVGGLTRFGEDLRRPVGPLHWACADIAGVGHMHMEGGVRSGEAAAAAAAA